MAAEQNRVKILLGTDNSINVKKVETTIRHAKQPQLSVRVSMVLINTDFVNEML